MEGVVTLTVDEYLLLGIAMAFCGVMGLRRGIRRELFSMTGIVLAMLLSSTIASVLEPTFTQLLRLARAALPGGLTFLGTATEGQLLVLLVFALIVLASFLWAQDRVPPAHSLMPRVLGLLAGGINGFLISFYLFPLLFPEPRAVIAVPSRELNATLANGRTLAWVAVFLVVVLIAFGLYSASGPRERH